MTTTTSTGVSAPDASRFQVPLEVAERYEAVFVPALFAAWAGQLVEAVGVHDGDRVLDVACGTGIVARSLADRAPGALVEGVDLNPAMLEVARRVRPDLTWSTGDAAALPYADAAFDLVTCSAALMFFPDPVAALRELARVTGPDGRVGLLVVGRLAGCPAHARLAELADRHAGAPAGDLVRGYFALGEPDRLGALLETGGLAVTSWRTTVTGVDFPSVEAFVTTEIDATALGSRLDASTRDRLVVDAGSVLAGYGRTDGPGLSVPLEAHVVVARPAGVRPSG